MRSVQVNPYSDTIVDNAKTPSSASRLSRLAAGKPAVPKRPAADKTSAAPAPRSTSTVPGRPLIRASVAPKPAAVQARSPNQQHVLSVRAAAAPTTRSSTTRNSTAMPIGDKPRPPQLSAGAGAGVARGSTRAPLTPKVAVRGQAATTTTATTPMARRSGSSITGAQSPRSDVSSVTASSYLSHSTTSRSGTRQTRAESTHTTPNSTPNLDKLSDGWETKSNRSSRGLGVSPLARTDSMGSRKSIGNSSNGPGDDSKFFYASSIKPAAPTSHPPRPASVVHTKTTPTFFYASDAASKRVTSPPSYPSSSSHSLSSAQEGVATKFFYANGAPDVDVRLSARSSGSGSTVSSGSKAPRPNTSASSVAGSSTVQLHSRPASPSKNLTHPTLPLQQQQHHQQSPQSTRTSAMSPTSPVRSSAHPSPTWAGSASQVGKRRVSIEAPLRLKQGHGRAGSVHSIDGVVTPKIATPTIAPPMIHAPEMTPPLLSPGLAQLSQPVTMATILQMADELEDEEDEDSEGEDGEGKHSDDSDSESRSHKRLSQNSEPLDHLVLSARRERKVQDLEITNASLEAINRTLERQLRKQSAELRRFRRLSRAGRLPTATNQGVSLSVPDASGGLTDVSEKEEDANVENQEYDDDDDEDEEEEEEEEDEDSLVDSDLSNENAATDPKSTDAQAKADSPSAKRRKRDERRLQLDLTKHQELLLDSQKMNQSLKKCLNWTDLLIKEGQKALAYRVKIADVDAMPGRVLAASYYDYGEETSQAGDDTISTVSASHFGDDTISIAESETWPKEAQDRDSGIELRAAGH
ncbi:uncharacterized protein TrAFT101_005883 [Trichoderma asperellum]|uniref:Uncharacterized protein n=1 Tax=Trichoderma asperellum (strain ATCC 204424 / CBS 433.97 / NBRC 101777) TaxID=1042311 RepID=A0A2T3Z7C9_TRIA4|nr:hypothetical protein M441DRAFT_410951 [Trichoderma asperellum CBS 433.97]PTB40717.1 hypothetical protein M441DRAFT_410951 [Trichoderma asperellum CBS 433.97]UKZ90884.1 hypothetical protein TrAFT101_005883 [Trichoderma asperellum]